MAEIKNFPAIRFKGFSECWEEDILGNRLDIENGYAFKSVNFQDEPNDLIVLTPGNVHIGGGFQKDKGRYYSEAGEIPSRFILEPNDIFVTMTDLTPTAQTLGYPAVIPNDGNTYLLNQRLGKIVNFEGDKNFLLQILCTEKNHKQIVSNATGTTVKHSSPQKILSVLNHFPSRIEQAQIGSYFQHLDRLISLHQAKVNKLTNLKKAMLEKMFPKQGADVPEIRFIGFEGAWEEDDLGQLAKITTGSSNRVDSGLDGDYTFFDRSDDIRTSNIYLFDCEAVIVAGEGSDFVPKYFVGKFDLHQRTYAIMNFDKLVGKFLYYYIYLFRKHFLDYAVGSTVKSLRLPMFKEMPIKYPNEAEQEKIGCYFYNLDKSITLHQTELEKLNNLKKACLEKMFV